MLTTKSEHYLEGQGTYTREREIIHNQIVHDLLKDIAPAPDKPLSIFLGGGSASGKTSISKMLVQSFKDEGEGVILIDSDYIKTKLPEYKELIRSSPEQAAAILHDESSDISEKLFDFAIQKKVNLIFDGTMKNAEKYSNLIQQVKAKDYSTSIVIADVPLAEAFRRAEIRFQIEKRRVPEEIIRYSHENVPRTFLQLKDKVDSFYLYDTSSRYPEQFYAQENKQLLVHKEERLSQFYSKGDIIQTQQKLIDILKLHEGLPISNNLTSETLNKTVNNFFIRKIDEGQTLYYHLAGGDQLQKLELRQYPFLTIEKKNMLLEQSMKINVSKSTSLNNSIEI